MLPSLRLLTNIPAPVLLVLAAMATQRSVVRAQAQGGYPYYTYWLSPGRIVGIAIGAIALILLILSMLILACRRRRRAKAPSRPNFPSVGGQPQAFPSWREAQQPVQTPFGPDATNLGRYYPAQSTAFSGQTQRTAPSEQVPRTAPFGEAQGTPPSPQVQRPAPTRQVPSTATSAQAPSTVSSGQAQRDAPLGQAQSNAPSGPVQSIAPSGRTQSTPPLVRAQEQGAPPPPRHAHTKGTLSADTANGRDQSPPPYSPPTSEQQ